MVNTHNIHPRTHNKDINLLVHKHRNTHAHTTPITHIRTHNEDIDLLVHKHRNTHTHTTPITHTRTQADCAFITSYIVF